MQTFIFTCSFCVHLDADYSQVGCADAHTSALLFAFGLCSSHLLDGVDSHDGHSVSWDHTVTQIPDRGRNAQLAVPHISHDVEARQERYGTGTIINEELKSSLLT